MTAQYLDTRDLKNAMLTCKHFHNSMKDEIYRCILWCDSKHARTYDCKHSTWTRATQISSSPVQRQLLAEKIRNSDCSTKVRRLKFNDDYQSGVHEAITFYPLLHRLQGMKAATIAGSSRTIFSYLPRDNLESLRLDERGTWVYPLDIPGLISYLTSSKLRNLEICRSEYAMNLCSSPRSRARVRGYFKNVAAFSLKRIAVCGAHAGLEHLDLLLGICKNAETLILHCFDPACPISESVEQSWPPCIPFEIIRVSVRNLWLKLNRYNWRIERDKQCLVLPTLADCKSLKRLVLDSVSLFGKCDLGPADGVHSPYPRTKYLEDLLPETIEDLTLYTVLDYPDSHRDAIVQIEGYMQASVQGVKCLPCLTRICLISDYSAVVYERVNYDRSRFKCVKDCSEAWCGQRDVISGCDLRSFHPPPMSRESTDADQPSREESIAWSYSQELDLQTNAYLTDPFEFGI